jgi:hypothetical protein
LETDTGRSDQGDCGFHIILAAGDGALPRIAQVTFATDCKTAAMAAVFYLANSPKDFQVALIWLLPSFSENSDTYITKIFSEAHKVSQEAIFSYSPKVFKTAAST